MMDQTPIQVQAQMPGGAEDYTVHYVSSGINPATFKQKVGLLSDNSPGSFYLK